MILVMQVIVSSRMVLLAIFMMVLSAQCYTQETDSSSFKVLPVTFHKFRATIEKGQVMLEWTIDTDDNFSHYVVERSVDGKDYLEIGKVQTSAWANPQEVSSYSFHDLNVPQGSRMIYYRLSWEEKNKRTYYSPVKMVLIGKEGGSGQMLAYPNPVKDQLQLTFPASWQGKQVAVQLYSAGGVLVQSLSLKTASQTETLRMGNLQRGFYLVKAQCENLIIQNSIIKN